MGSRSPLRRAKLSTLDHDDALVILVGITNARVKIVMVDIERSADVLYLNAFQKLGLTKKDLTLMTSALTGFTGDSISPLRTTTMPVTIEEPRSKTMMVMFIVVDLPSVYNAILSRSTLNKLRAVVFTYHRAMKFPTGAEIGEMRSDPRESRQCYLTIITLPKKLKPESCTLAKQSSTHTPWP